MSIFSLFSSIIHRVSVSPRWPLILYAATWTTLLTVTVAVASFSPELAFVSVISPNNNNNSLYNGNCRNEESVRVPVDIPAEIFCIPVEMFKRSKMDMVVPPVFAAVIVACSAYVVRALALWEEDEIVFVE